MNMNRDIFYNEFIKPFIEDDYIKKEYNIDFYWSGYEANLHGYKAGSDCYGVCYWENNGSVIVLKYRTDLQDTLATFIHELGHAILHLNFDEERLIREIEAESVTKEIFESLGIEYKRNRNYEDKYYAKYRKKYDVYDTEKADLYEFVIDLVVSKLSPKLDLIKSLPNKKLERKRQENKYTVECPLCNTIWKYKRLCKIVSTNAKGYYCCNCGKEKTKDKLIVKTL